MHKRIPVSEEIFFFNLFNKPICPNQRTSEASIEHYKYVFSSVEVVLCVGRLACSLAFSYKIYIDL